ELLQLTMKEPVSYGWFHLLFCGLVVLMIIFLCSKFPNPTEKTVNKILKVFCFVLIGFELYKQFVFSYSINDGIVVWNYQWYSFPFQFCSTPMYAGLIALLAKSKSWKEKALAFLSTYAVFAGIAVMIYPNDVFIEEIGINIQTMVHHGAMIVLGVYLLYSRVVPIKIKTLAKASVLFIIFLSIALFLNIVIYKADINEVFNMFYISPYYKCTLPVLSAIYAELPYFWFLLTYTLGFTFVALLILALSYYIKKMRDERDDRHNHLS
ncbi:MAG: YwaF family protein, partial [Bacilli bacterium]|nr:YwaF family protein [Bacilli bacterium]